MVNENQKITTTQIGKFGEDEAKRYLESKQYQFIESNFKTRYGEIDLIMRQGDIIVFVEVKLRRSNRFSLASDAVNLRKIKKLAKTMGFWLDLHNLSNSIVRFDVIEVYAFKGYKTGTTQINHMINAFDRFENM